MRTTTRKRAVTVGIFILLGLAIFVAGILVLGGQKRTFEKKIKLRAIFTDVGGLQLGNNVWFSGVKVGTVDKIKFFGISQVEVIMNVEKKVQQYIRRNAKASIGAEGFIGNKLVVIDGGSMNQPVIEDGGLLGVKGTMSTDEIMNTLQKNNLNLLEITNEFKLISKKLAEGQGSLGRLIADPALINSLEATAITMKQASLNTQQLTSNLADYTEKLQAKGSFAHDLIADTIIFHRLQATATQMDEVSKTATDVTNNLKAASQSLSNSLSNSGTPLGVLLNDKETADNLRATMKNLQISTEKLDENMEAMQHNFLFKGYFKKKAKEEEKQAKQSQMTKEPNGE